MTGRAEMWEVDVPIQDPDGLRTGVHVFTGLASDRYAAIAAARSVVDEALEHLHSGREIPVPPSPRIDWAARGLRPGWELRWEGAKAHQITL
ncbi:hypothetical protein ACIBL8_21515 [Streptomyces sp. NPDC050523]|uniref:hypothetical protein n=1 Tax=Streptomyces sp. NPDC050523 TaxID=3365622 RepID=UPI0037BD8F0C